MSQSLVQEFLNAHNAARARVGVRPLTWDNRVAAFAHNYANRMADNSNLTHSGGPYGENLAGDSGDLSATAAVDRWVREKEFYNYNANSSSSGEVVGHYTQVVWLNSVRLGCAKARRSDGGTFIICNYDPPGNYRGQRPY